MDANILRAGYDSSKEKGSAFPTRGTVCYISGCKTNNIKFLHLSILTIVSYRYYLDHTKLPLSFTDLQSFQGTANKWLMNIV